MYFTARLNDQPEESDKSRFNVADGYIDFTDEFKYLGTTISKDLRENREIQLRIAKAAKSMGALRHFFNNKHVNLRTKYLIYLAIPINIVLCSCKAWGTTKDHIKKLEAFHHKSIRSILKINMHQVKEQRITNEQIREKFLDIRNIGDFISERQLRWLSKIAQMDDTRLPRQLLTAWCDNPRPRGRPQQTIRNCQVRAIQRILPSVSEEGRTAEWIDIAADRAAWSGLLSAAGLREKCVSR